MCPTSERDVLHQREEDRVLYEMCVCVCVCELEMCVVRDMLEMSGRCQDVVCMKSMRM